MVALSFLHNRKVVSDDDSSQRKESYSEQSLDDLNQEQLGNLFRGLLKRLDLNQLDPGEVQELTDRCKAQKASNTVSSLLEPVKATVADTRKHLLALDLDEEIVKIIFSFVDDFCLFLSSDSVHDLRLGYYFEESVMTYRNPPGNYGSRNCKPKEWNETFVTRHKCIVEKVISLSRDHRVDPEHAVLGNYRQTCLDEFLSANWWKANPWMNNFLEIPQTRKVYGFKVRNGPYGLNKTLILDLEQQQPVVHVLQTDTVPGVQEWYPPC